jgi:hypothetical protein
MGESSRLIAYRFRESLRRRRRRSNVLARLHTLEATPEEYEAGLRLVQDDLLPWARESSGYCGAIGLVDADSGRALLLTLWADDEARANSAAAADRLGSLAADATGARRQSIENFEVSLFDVLGAPGAGG